jgi:hypothetical protein
VIDPRRSRGGEEVVARLDDAKLVALGVGEDDMGVVGPLTDPSM